MRLFCGIAPEPWAPSGVMRLMQTIIRSAKAMRALLTIVSLEDSPIRVKRFYERGVLQENERMGDGLEMMLSTLSLCGRLRFRS